MSALPSESPLDLAMFRYLCFYNGLARHYQTKQTGKRVGVKLQRLGRGD